MIRCDKIQFSYPGEAFDLKIDSLEVLNGETVALVGPSGCGKTTLLNLISGNLLPQSGGIEVADVAVPELRLHERQQFRIRRIGLIPQSFDLLDYLTVRENIMLPYRVSGALKMDGEVQERCDALAERTGISNQLDKLPGQLSTGERQRVAVCRGLINSPELILADEPTGNLDPENQDLIVSLILEEAARIGATVMMITHERSLCSRFERTVDVLAIREEAAE